MIYSYHKLKEVCFIMIENLVGTLLLAIWILCAILLIFDVYEARKDKNKIGYFVNSLLLFVALFFIINCPIFSWSVYNYIGG